ncbi:MAG: toprim domain-containing protein [Pseudomonadota bacterium]
MTDQKNNAARAGEHAAASGYNYTANHSQTPTLPQDVENRFLDFMHAVGLTPVKDTPIADGRIHRYRVEGDKPGSRNGWYALHLDPIPHGAVGSWRTNETHPWRDAEARRINWQERQALQAKMRALRNDRYQAQQTVYAEARAKAEKMWRASRPADAAHPYLQRKGVKAWGIRQLRDQLLVPVRRDGALHSLQLIGPDGEKKFLTGGRIGGCYFAIGKPAGTICVAEGYATAATVFECTGYATAVAFNAGNLKRVAQHLACHHPHTKFILIADDDQATPGNPGLTAATEAAMLVGGFVARPHFGFGEGRA